MGSEIKYTTPCIGLICLALASTPHPPPIISLSLIYDLLLAFPSHLHPLFLQFLSLILFDSGSPSSQPMKNFHNPDTKIAILADVRMFV